MLYCVQAFVKALLKYNTHTLEKSPVLLTRGFFDGKKLVPPCTLLTIKNLTIKLQSIK